MAWQELAKGLASALGGYRRQKEYLETKETERALRQMSLLQAQMGLDREGLGLFQLMHPEQIPGEAGREKILETPFGTLYQPRYAPRGLTPDALRARAAAEQAASLFNFQREEFEWKQADRAKALAESDVLQQLQGVLSQMGEAPSGQAVAPGTQGDAGFLNVLGGPPSSSASPDAFQQTLNQLKARYEAKYPGMVMGSLSGLLAQQAAAARGVALSDAQLASALASAEKTRTETKWMGPEAQAAIDLKRVQMAEAQAAIELKRAQATAALAQGRKYQADAWKALHPTAGSAKNPYAQEDVRSVPQALAAEAYLAGKRTESEVRRYLDDNAGAAVVAAKRVMDNLRSQYEKADKESQPVLQMQLQMATDAYQSVAGQIEDTKLLARRYFRNRYGYSSPAPRPAPRPAAQAPVKSPKGKTQAGNQYRILED
jgi:hypothetical protein